jgi:uncharacterized damage-inducible protein DinB
MINEIDYNKLILDAWKTTNRTTTFLIENIPDDLWNEKAVGLNRTVGMIAAHINNSRCMWIKNITRGETFKIPANVDPFRAKRKEVVIALNRSSHTMLKLLQACIDNRGRLPSRPIWLNFPNDVIHFLSYFVAHEAHHRGQIIILARNLNHRLPAEVTDGVWQWTRRLKEG